MDKIENHFECYLLDGKIRLYQPHSGFKAGIDPIFLSAAVAEFSPQDILDVGCGVGTASLCLKHHLKSCQIKGVELQKEMLDLAQKNVILNSAEQNIHLIHADINKPQKNLALGGFDATMSNPPYFEDKQAIPSPHKNKAISHIESCTTLRDWVKFCTNMLKHKGYYYFIFRIDRLDKLIHELVKVKAGDIHIFPLWPKKDSKAKRVLVRARKGVQSPVSLLPGFVIHKNDGKYTKEAEEILKQGKILRLK